MKKLEDDVKPVIYETKSPNEGELMNVKQYYSAQLVQQPMLSQHICQLANEMNREIQGAQFRKFHLRKPGQSLPDSTDTQMVQPNYVTNPADVQALAMGGSGYGPQGYQYPPASSD